MARHGAESGSAFLGDTSIEKGTRRCAGGILFHTSGLPADAGAAHEAAVADVSGRAGPGCRWGGIIA